MTVQITIIGLGQIGCSIGLALTRYKGEIHRVGHDKDREAMTHAKEKDAVDKLAITLSGAVKDADIVFLALPQHEVDPVLRHISQDLKEDTLVIDTAPLKTEVRKLAEESLPANCYYVGLTPVIGSEFLEDFDFGHKTAADDIFRGNLMGIIGGKNTPEKAINMACSLVELLGAQPYFSDAAEIDGLMAMTHVLPQLLAASLLKLSQETPGWKEARKIAGKPYSQVTNPFGQDEVAGALAAGLLADPENSRRLLNDMIRILVDIHDQIGSLSQEELEESFRNLQQARDLWLDDRRKGNWMDTPLPEIKKVGLMSQLLGFREAKKPPKKSDR